MRNCAAILCFVTAACVANTATGTRDEPLACIDLWRMQLPGNVKGYCSGTGRYEYEQISIQFGEHILDSLSVLDHRWVEGQQKSARLSVLARYETDAQGSPSIVKIIESTMLPE